MYLTYQEYEAMGGTLDETLFNDICYEGQTYIDYQTYGRLKAFTTIPMEVKKCLYQLVDLVSKKRELINSSSGSGDSVGISSQSNDGVSISYNNISASELYKLLSQTEIESVIKRYLYGVKDSKSRLILYRGVYRDDIG